MDLAVTGAACLVFAPLAAMIAVATLIDDGRPVLFVQPRIGLGRRGFEVFKFRSMRDGHVTRVGRWLRRTGLDELPQFLNVYRGEMSVVGPRPLTHEDIRRLGFDQARYDWRFEATPGITGLSQLLAGRGVAASRRLDRLYRQRQGPLLDLRLIALSFAANLVGKRTLRELILQRKSRDA